MKQPNADNQMNILKNRGQIRMIIILLIGSFSFWLVPYGFLALQKATAVNFSKKSDKENLTNILNWNFKQCNAPVYIGREYGEGTFTVKCSNRKAYLLYSIEHCDFLDVYCWNIEPLDSNTLERKRSK